MTPNADSEARYNADKVALGVTHNPDVIKAAAEAMELLARGLATQRPQAAETLWDIYGMLFYEYDPADADT